MIQNRRKKSKKINSAKKKSRGLAGIGSLSVVAIIVLVSAFAYTLIGTALPPVNPTNPNAQQVVIQTPVPSPDQTNLQLYTFKGMTITPSPIAASPPPAVSSTTGGDCPTDSIKPTGSTCQCIDSNAIACPESSGQQECLLSEQLPLGSTSGPVYCITLEDEGGAPSGGLPTPPAGCFDACIGKPVIYLYPTKPTEVSVSLDIPGQIVKSNPSYPTGGWKNIEALPGGTLTYDNQKYTELFYESSINKPITQPSTGVVIPTGNLKETLSSLTLRLGLLPNEKLEFLTYWLPILNNLHAPYILFSILPPSVKENVDQVNITPTPDTRIEFIAYFKPLQSPITISPLALPAEPPKRVGFTEVEWGGTIGY